MTFLVRVPIVPHPCLLPNAQRRTHFHTWGPEARALREATAWSAAMSPDLGPTITGPVRIKAVIAWPKRRSGCDFQAAVHALKAAVDGLEDAQVIANDRQVKGMDIEQIRAEKDDKVGWFTLELVEAT